MSSDAEYCCERMRYDLEETCALHHDRSECPDSFIERVRGGYGLIVHDGGSSVMEILFCPWCGTPLPSIAALDLSGDQDV